MILVSASQITTYANECKRKWAFRSIAKIQTPPNPSAALGIEVEELQLQPYLRDGKTFDFSRSSGEIAASSLGFLPAPQTPGLVLQKRFEFGNPEKGYGFLGYMDMWHRDSAVMPGIEPAPDWHNGVPLVGDFKTTSDLKWQKSESTLATDVQAMLYAYAAMYETRVPVVDLAWIYMQTRGTRKARRTYLRVHAPHVKEQFDSINAIAGEICGVRGQLAGIDPMKAPLELEPNPLQCDEYGGCPYRAQCNLSPDVFGGLSIAEDINMSNTSGFMSRLKKQREASLGDLTEAAPVPVTAAPSITPLVDIPINPPEAALLDVEAPATSRSPEPAPAPATKKRGRPAKAPADIIMSYDPTVTSEPPIPVTELTRLEAAFVAAASVFLNVLNGGK